MKAKDIYILFDCPDERNDKKWLIDGSAKIHGEGVHSVSIDKTLSRLARTGRKGLIECHWIMMKQCIRALKLSKRDDLIICWEHTTGLYMNKLSMLFGNKRDIILMNWLTPPSVCKKRRRKMLTAAASNSRTRIVVNSPESPDKWRDFLDMDLHKDFLILPDVYDSAITFLNVREKEEKYCFTGGMNNRNWRMVWELASRHREIMFVCVALEVDFKNQVDELPDNMEVYFDVPTEQYYNLMKNAYLILLPLKDKKVAGLINILRAAQYSVPCMITRTPAAQQYYGNGMESLLMSDDIQDWEKEIVKWFSLDFVTYKANTEIFCEYIKKEFSPEKAVEKLMEVFKL